jgi:DNA-binding MarR family transcriptional regulator
VAADVSLEELSFPALLRGARATYGLGIRAALEGGGYDDVPVNGIFVLSAVARTGAPLAEIIAGLRVSKQAGGALVDTLVVRGYLERASDPADRRRLIVTLTPRGAVAAEVIRGTVAAIDERLAGSVSRNHVAHARETLIALIELGDDRA